jgi:hypothetical protein
MCKNGTSKHGQRCEKQLYFLFSNNPTTAFFSQESSPTTNMPSEIYTHLSSCAPTALPNISETFSDRDYLKYLRHYIYIDSNNVNKNISEDPVLKQIKLIHNKYYKNGEIVKYWSYNDIYVLLKDYDTELAALFLSINVNYPALLADIGRFIILYRFGGIYHDLKFISNLSMICYLDKVGSITFIGETNPTEPSRVRNGNIAVLEKGHPLLLSVLTQIKKKLNAAKEDRWFGSKLMVLIGSRIYKEIFDMCASSSIIKYPMLSRRLIAFNNEIYKGRSCAWQKTEEFLFTY